MDTGRIDAATCFVHTADFVVPNRQATHADGNGVKQGCLSKFDVVGNVSTHREIGLAQEKKEPS